MVNSNALPVYLFEGCMPYLSFYQNNTNAVVQMNTLLTIGLLLVIGYASGWLFDKIGLPKILAYIITGIVFSPNTSNLVNVNIIEATHPLMDVCLAFIAFEVGGALKWSKVKAHEKEILSITILASLIPFILITTSVYSIGILFPEVIPFDSNSLLILALLLGALASSTAPAATLAVIHQYKARGKVTSTILGVAALDDVLGIMLFSLVLAAIYTMSGSQTGIFGNPVLNALYEIGGSILVGALLGYLIDLLSRFFKMKSEGQWVVIVFSLMIFCAGISKQLHLDLLLSSMTMGIIVVNRCKQQHLIFKILERYTEDLIFLFFFILSGLHLDILSLPKALTLIVIFVVLRVLGKFLGTYIGASAVNSAPSIRKYTAGGLLPQAGIVIGLVLSIYQEAEFKDLSEILLTTIMGATVIHEIIGPIAAKYSLVKAGEITTTYNTSHQNRTDNR